MTKKAFLVSVALGLALALSTVTFAQEERQFDIQLPRVGQAQPLTAPPDEIVVNVFADGRLVVNKKTLEPNDLQQLLAEAHSRYADQAVLVRGDGKGTYQTILTPDPGLLAR